MHMSPTCVQKVALLFEQMPFWTLKRSLSPPIINI
jgi:hypothetical protein